MTLVGLANRAMGLFLHCSTSASHEVRAFHTAHIADGLGLDPIKPKRAR